MGEAFSKRTGLARMIVACDDESGAIVSESDNRGLRFRNRSFLSWIFVRRTLLRVYREERIGGGKSDVGKSRYLIKRPNYGIL